MLPKNIRPLNLKDFKQKVSTLYKPKRYKHFSKGSKEGNKLLTRIRVGRSLLNAHLFAIGATDDPHCLCNSVESSVHYMIQCTLYTSQRQTLFGLFEQYVPQFDNMTNKQKHEIILNGYNIDNDEFIYINTRLTLAVQKYIIDTNRFSLG